MKNFIFSPSTSNYQIQKLIGSEITEGVKGSTVYFIQSFYPKDSLWILENSKGIFQLYSKGLLLRTFKNNKEILITIPFDDVSKLELVKGKEIIRPLFFSPMWILLKIGVPVEIARYFRVMASEYSIDPTSLHVTTVSFQLNFQTNGYTFKGQNSFFSKLSDIDNLIIKRR